MELEFKKENESTISVKVPDEIVNYIDNVLSTVSLNVVTNFDSYITMELEDKLLSRYITAILFDKYKNTMNNSYGFLLVHAYYKGRVVLISMGEIPIDQHNKTIANGVLYE